MDLVEQVYRVAKALPAQERFGLASQIQRAAVSIPANVAEGHSRTHRGDYLHHLSMARGSLAELETHLTLAVRLDLVKREAVVPIWDLCQRVGKLLNALIAALRRNPAQPLTPSP
ncbi:MAG TPA: four helix bundle protein [Phycisphaerae bacterium]|nr:four helix bundle protein [Phycisphaerae bacterium]HNU44211.1 four helix bundle protein [Phycisphaerae bacterium]